MANKGWQVDARAWDEFIRPRESDLIVGATLADPGLFPDGLGISRRSQPRNEYLGLVMTRPDEDVVVLGLNYYDAADEGDNEDMYKLDLDGLWMTPYMRGSFEKEYPQYAPHHREAKPYLRPEEII